jgi:adenylate cyclase, class 2
MQEIEAKILEIDRSAVEQKLIQLGAHLAFTHEFFAIYFDDAAGNLRANKEVLRIRKEGTEQRMTFKAPSNETHAGINTREELDIAIGDFEMMRVILGRLGYQEGLKMRKYRTQYELGSVHIVIDTHIDDLAFIPPYLEIEAPTHELLLEACLALGFDTSHLLDWSAARVMEFYRNK